MRREAVRVREVKTHRDKAAVADAAEQRVDASAADLDKHTLELMHRVRGAGASAGSEIGAMDEVAVAVAAEVAGVVVVGGEVP